jgi:hypothetical protein
MKNLMVICLGLAVVAAVAYFLAGANILTVPGLNADEAPAAIPYVAGGCYILGGLLIFTKRRGLWIFGAIINVVVIAFFFMMYNQKPDIMLSTPGLVTKITQVLLEVGLVYLIVNRNRELVPAH